MIVFSRQRDESFMIGDDIEVIVIDVRGDKVRLGITTPKEFAVHRREIYDAIQCEKRQKIKTRYRMTIKELVAAEEEELSEVFASPTVAELTARAKWNRMSKAEQDKELIEAAQKAADVSKRIIEKYGGERRSKQ